MPAPVELRAEFTKVAVGESNFPAYTVGDVGAPGISAVCRRMSQWGVDSEVFRYCRDSRMVGPYR